MKVATTTLVWPLSCVSLWMQGAKTCTSGEIVANAVNANTSVRGGKRMRKTRGKRKTRNQKTRKQKQNHK